MSNEDLSFWMDSDSSGTKDVSDDGDIPIPSSETTLTRVQSEPNPPRSTNMRTRASRSQSEVVQKLQLEAPPLKVNPIDVSSESDGERSMPERNPEVDLMRWTRARIASELEAMKRACTAEDDIVIVPSRGVGDMEQKQDGDFTLVFETPDGTEYERVLKKNGIFVNVMKTLPPELQQCRISIDGVVMDAEDVIADILGDYMKIKLEPLQVPSTEGFKKLSFALPNGEKKKLLVDEQWTFGEVLVKLACPNARLYFDGYAIDPSQKVGDNDEIEDGEQIDVRM